MNIEKLTKLKMNMEKLTKEELLALSVNIDTNLKKIEQIEKMKNKTKLSQLVIGDKIFGIAISGKTGHRLEESTDEISTTWQVSTIDYFDVDYTDKKNRNSEYHRISIKHPEKSIGISTSLSDEEADKHYYLSLSTSRNGYDDFYTLKPETWETDIIAAYSEIISSRRKRYDNEISIINDKLDIFIKEKDKINKFI